MPKPAKSQWDFGELFPQEATRRVLTVSELTAEVKRLLERQVGQVWVTGEVTNFRAQSSGHCYFTLKDAGSQLSCVLFRGVAASQRDSLCDGAKVVLHGEVTVYEARGQYQLIVRAVELQGVGALQQAFERLKAKLAAEGLFAPERKRPIPRFPQRIGLVTSPTGAAIRDVLHVIGRRQPGLEIILVPCRVQGDGAAEEVAAAIGLLNQWAAGGASEKGRKGEGEQGGEGERENGGSSPPPPLSLSPTLLRSSRVDSRLDVILVTRGGGSLEDLWAFNEESVARAMAASKIPVVSAIGHEIDFTIADFVADLRAATPSAAAELITEGVFASREFVAEAGTKLRRLAGRGLTQAREDFEGITHRLGLAHPRRRVEDGSQRLDDLRESLLRAAQLRREHCRSTLREMDGLLRRRRPRELVAARRETLRELARRLRETAAVGFERARLRQASAGARLLLLGPQNVLARGYSITMDAATGRVLRDAGMVRAGQKLTTRFKEGEIRSIVEGNADGGETG